MEKIQNSYETVLVISLKLGDEGVAAMVQKFKDLIEANATLESVDEWGKRRLAYLINKLAKGFVRSRHIESNSRLCMASASSGRDCPTHSYPWTTR